ncbi:hypothetical protein GCM10020331_064280 [Ectobacillus funiculus]
MIRNYTKEDFDELIAIQSESFPPPFPPELWWNKEQLTEHVTRFPQGALCVEINGTLAGSMTGLIVQLDRYDTHHTWAEITDNGYIRNHNQKWKHALCSGYLHSSVFPQTQARKNILCKQCMMLYYI